MATADQGMRTALPLVVRWAECDAAGIIFHGRVFEWFSEARVAWLAQAGLSYYHDVVPLGVELLVTRATAAFQRPLRPGDAVVVEARVTHLTPARMHFGYRVLRDGLRCADGETQHGFVMHGRAGNLKKAHAALYEQLLAGTAASDGDRGFGA
jgi:acyl-CoA thioester hydrolase